MDQFVYHGMSNKTSLLCLSPILFIKIDGSLLLVSCKKITYFIIKVKTDKYTLMNLNWNFNLKSV